MEESFPKKTPLDDIDFDFLSKLKISGGEKKNIALTAAFQAEKNSDKITMGHIVKAVKRESQKKGKVHPLKTKRKTGKNH